MPITRLLIQIEGDRHDDQHQGEDESVAAVARVQRGVDLVEKVKNRTGSPSRAGCPECAQDADESEHHGGTQRGASAATKRIRHSRWRRFMPADGARLLHLRIDGRQGARHQQEAIGVVVQCQTDDDGEEAIA